MGSGELTATMVEVHKDALAALGAGARAAFLDTPAGFQLNADQISQKALSYFASQIQHPLTIVSFKSAAAASPAHAETAFHELRRARYVLVGPGSPTYAVRQWRQTPIPDILKKNIAAGACLSAASAAALTVGRYTLPVYELYKVGEDLHWTEGIDILGHFGIVCAVVPHWNNAEGGTHDTRFCFMGEPRFRMLESLLPTDALVLGIDEHTACIIDLDAEQVLVRGLGGVTVRRRGAERIFMRGERFSLAVLRGAGDDLFPAAAEKPAVSAAAQPAPGFWEQAHDCEQRFAESIDDNRAGDAAAAVLDLDRIIWQALEQQEDPERIAQAREIFREMLVLAGSRMAALPHSREACLAPLVEALLALRSRYRQARQWVQADDIRACLEQAGVIIEDGLQQTRWRLATK